MHVDETQMKSSVSCHSGFTVKDFPSKTQCTHLYFLSRVDESAGSRVFSVFEN